MFWKFSFPSFFNVIQVFGNSRYHKPQLPTTSDYRDSTVGVSSLVGSTHLMGRRHATNLYAAEPQRLQCGAATTKLETYYRLALNLTLEIR